MNSSQHVVAVARFGAAERQAKLPPPTAQASIGAAKPGWGQGVAAGGGGADELDPDVSAAGGGGVGGGVDAGGGCVGGIDPLTRQRLGRVSYV